MRLFAEAAIPTALALSCENVVTEYKLGENWVTGSANDNVHWHGKEIWNIEEMNKLEKSCDNKIAKLLNSFDHNLLYIHPIKLSKWG